MYLVISHPSKVHIQAIHRLFVPLWVSGTRFAVGARFLQISFQNSSQEQNGGFTMFVRPRDPSRFVLLLWQTPCREIWDGPRSGAAGAVKYFGAARVLVSLFIEGQRRSRSIS